ncbi:MAG: lipid-binding SYLF domain-containing protein [bacterium]|jgi:lipid-binding SYLF domain-containing protein
MTRFALAIALFAVPLLADDNTDRLSKAATVLSEVMTAPDQGIPQDLLNKAECAIVVPGLKKGAFIIGAKYGRGYVSCRKQQGPGWSAPAAVRVEGGSFGFQIGGSETDVVMLVLNERGVERLLSSKFTLGGDASVAAGPVGRTAEAQTDAYMTAEILTWSRSRGVFAGIALTGATLRQDLDVNRALYGKTLENKEILRGDLAAPAAASELLSILNKYSSRK